MTCAQRAAGGQLLDVEHLAVGQREGLDHRAGDLDPLDRVDAEVGLDVGVEVEHLRRVAGALADDLEQVLWISAAPTAGVAVAAGAGGGDDAVRSRGAGARAAPARASAAQVSAARASAAAAAGSGRAPGGALTGAGAGI